MSEETLVDVLGSIIQSFILVVVIAKSIRMMPFGKKSILPFFFVLTMASCLLSNLYWIAYDLINPDTRMPIAANEIAECAAILLLSAGLNSVLKNHQKVPWEILFAIFYTAGNIVLWIVWSGEWFQDIFFGIPYIYFLWVLIRGLRSREFMPPKELCVVAVTSVVVLAMLAMLPISEGHVYAFAKYGSYVVKFALMVWLGIRSFQSKDVFVVSTFFLWTNLAMFSSAECYYYIAFFANTVAFPFMYISMEKELSDNDIC